MLVLSRKLNQKVKIGEDIEITIVSISGDSVRLGIDAPKQVKILRDEVIEEIKGQNQEAVLTGSLSDALRIIAQLNIENKS
jgi:carbon storage regulator